MAFNEELNSKAEQIEHLESTGEHLNKLLDESLAANRQNNRRPSVEFDNILDFDHENKVSMVLDDEVIFQLVLHLSSILFN